MHSAPILSTWSCDTYSFLECGEPLPTPVARRLHLQPDGVVPVLVLRIHPLNDIRYPPDSALPENELEVGVAHASPRVHGTNQELRPRQLEQALPKPVISYCILFRCISLGFSGRNPERVEGDRHVALIGNGPQHIPLLLVHGRAHLGDVYLSALKPHFRGLSQLRGRGLRIMADNTPQCPKPIRSSLHEFTHPLVVDVIDRRGDFGILEPWPRKSSTGYSQYPVDHFSIYSVNVLVFNPQVAIAGWYTPCPTPS